MKIRNNLRARELVAVLAASLTLFARTTSAQTGNGRVAREVRIGTASGGFAGDLAATYFGIGVAPIGDLDGDGVTDIAVGAPRYASYKGSVWILFLNADGTVKAQRLIAENQGGFTAALAEGDRFGWSVAGIGDVDADGVPDLAVGAIGVDEGAEEEDVGAVFILRLNADGTVKSHHEIDSSEWTFGGTLSEYGAFGTALSAIGDLNGDGVNELAVGAPWDSSVVYAQGAIFILFMNADGSVSSAQKISSMEGEFTGELERYDLFGIALAGTGDVDADGVPDLAVGAEHDDDGGAFSGAVWLLRLTAGGVVKSHAKISKTQGGFAGDTGVGEHFGAAVAAPGDLDGDGIGDLIVGQYTYVTPPDSDTNGRGAAWLLFLNSDQSVKANRRVSPDHNGFMGPLTSMALGWAVAPLGDLDADGRLDFAIGAPSLGNGDGAVWVVFMGEAPGTLCGTAPLTTCATPSRARMLLRASYAKDGKDRIQWSWQGASPGAGFGAPQLTTDYALCLWDSVSSSLLFKTDLAVAAGAFWSAEDAAFLYEDAAGSQEGVTRLSLRSGPREQIKIKGSGFELATPLPFAETAYFALEPSLTVQLVNSDGACWTSDFTTPKSSSNRKFVARTP